MNKTIIFLFILNFQILSLAQNNISFGKFVFEENVVTSKQSQLEYTLYFNDEKSLYILKKNISNDSTTTGNNNFLKKFIKNSQSNNKTPFYFRQKNGKKLYYTGTTTLKQYVVMDSTISFNWKIHEEKKMIGNFNCQKATSLYRGRDYTAWFAEDIPVDYGPRKYHGLPGLIIEIYDKDGKYHSRLKSASISSQYDKIDEILDEESIEKDNYITYNQFLLNQCSDAKEFEGIIKSKLPRNVSQFNITNIGGRKDNIEIVDFECD